MAAQAIARIGDECQGTCYLHPEPTAFTGTFATNGSGIAFCDGLGCVIVEQTIANLTCGHHGIPTTGSGLSGTTEGALHRVGDTGRVVEDTSGKSTFVTITGSGTSDSL
jgi:hypothetical protein